MKDPLHDLTLADVLSAHATTRPTARAAICGEDRYDYVSLGRRVDALAGALCARGVKGGDRLLWLGQNCHRLLEGLLAAAKLGAVFCPVNWRQSATEMTFVLDDSEPSVIFWQESEIGDTVREARSNVDGRALWIRLDCSARGGSARGGSADGGSDDDCSYEELVEEAPGGEIEVEADERDAVLMMYTAAFSGVPNGAMLSHRALILQGGFVAGLMDIGPDYVYLNCGPLFHVATFMSTLATFVEGGTNVFTPRVDAEELCRLIDAEHCTGAFVMPPTMDQMIELNSDGRYDLKSLRAFRGKPKWTEMITPDESPWGRRPAGYGQTEVMGLVTFNALGPCAGSHGRPAPFVRIGVLGPDDEELAPGETGEIAVRGPTVMNGYLRRPELNTERQAGGWHHTNDLGRIEEDGSLSFIGPKTRLIKSAAENIYPTEVEAALRSHPAVADAAVIGVPDPTWGQNVKAIVVLRKDAEAAPEDLIEHCRSSLASYKKPKSVEFTDELPRQGFAVDYKALDERFGGGGYPGIGKRAPANR